MAETLPRACLKYPNSQDDKAVYFQNIHDGLLASIATFPTPPVLPAALQTLIDAYTAALATALLLGKENVSAKNAAMKAVERALRVDCAYVNQIVFNLNAGGTPYSDLRTDIIATGYQINKTPTPAGPLSKGIILTSRSTLPGQLYLKIQSDPNASSYWIKYRPVTMPESDWIDYTAANTHVRINDLQRGVQYEAMSASIGASPFRTFSDSIFQYIV